MTSDEHARELRELRPFLEEAVDSLKSAERAILFARLFDERGFREISEELGKSESACKMSLSRTLEKLRKFLSARGITYSAVTLATLLQAEWARAAPLASLEALAIHSLSKSGSGLFTSTLTVMTHSKTLLIAGFALLFVACYQVVKKGPIQETQTPSAHRSSQGSTARPQASLREVRQRSPRKSGGEKPETTHEAKDLGEFYLPAMTFENTTLSEAMDAILARYREICRETGETPLSLDWKIEGVNQTIDRFIFEGNLLLGCMELGFFAHKRFQFDGSNFVFAKIQNPNGPSVVREWTVPPTFETFLRNLLSKQDEPASGSSDDSPFPEDGEAPEEAERVPLPVLLGEAGFLAEGESWELLPATSRLTVKAGARNLAHFDLLVKMAVNATPRQVRFSLRKSLNGVEEDLPSVVALPGQKATVEIGKEYPDLRSGEEIHAWVGARVSFEPVLYGLGERSEISFFFTSEPSEDALSIYQKSGNIKDLDLDEFSVEKRIVVTSDEHRLESLPVEFSGTDREGNRLGFSYTSERIDATGRSVFQRDPVTEEESNDGLPIPE